MKDIKAHIIGKKSLTHDILEFTLQPNEPIQYKAGQYLMIKVPLGVKFQYRAYSVANHPEDRAKGILRFVIKLLPQGLASEYLKIKRVGDEIEFRGGLGFFVYKSAASRQVMMIATGTGLAPLLCILEEEVEKNPETEFTLLWGNRFKVDIYYEDILQELAEKYSNFHYQLILSKPVGYWQGAKGYVTDYLKQHDLEAGADVYLCGHPQMIEDAKLILKEKNIPKERVFEEKYISLGKAQH